MVKRRRKSSNKKQVKFMIILTVICFLLAVVVSFITGRVPDLLNKMITKRIEGEIVKKVEETKKDLGKSDIERLKREYREKGER